MAQTATITTLKITPETITKINTNANNDDVDDCATPTPHEFLCPLTLEVMKDPLRDTITGQCYEKSAIRRWIFFGKATCPLTRRRLDPAQFVEDRYLKTKILLWRQQHEQEQLLLEEVAAASDDADDDDDDEEESLSDEDLLLEYYAREDQNATCIESASNVARMEDLLQLRNGVLKKRERMHIRSFSQSDAPTAVTVPPVTDFMALYQ